MEDAGLTYIYDPRPEAYRKKPGYTDHFRNTCIGYSGPEKDMAVLHMFRPANPYGVENDHNYITSAETFFLTTSSVSLHHIN